MSQHLRNIAATAFNHARERRGHPVWELGPPLSALVSYLVTSMRGSRFSVVAEIRCWITSPVQIKKRVKAICAPHCALFRDTGLTGCKSIQSLEHPHEDRLLRCCSLVFLDIFPSRGVITKLNAPTSYRANAELA